MATPSHKRVARDDLPRTFLTADAKRLLAIQRELLRSTGEKKQKLQTDLAVLRAASLASVEARRAKLPKPEFQSDLPVNERRADIAELIAKNQVVIVCGETGSGKTTQLPKICLDLGIGARGLIGHTQPRRLAALLRERAHWRQERDRRRTAGKRQSHPLLFPDFLHSMTPHSRRPSPDRLR